jgi:hypothetical protein
MSFIRVSTHNTQYKYTHINLAKEVVIHAHFGEYFYDCGVCKIASSE